MKSFRLFIPIVGIKVSIFTGLKVEFTVDSLKQAVYSSLLIVLAVSPLPLTVNEPQQKRMNKNKERHARSNTQLVSDLCCPVIAFHGLGPVL